MKKEDLMYEVIYGQVVSKSNNYQVGNNKHGDRYIIKSEAIKKYESSFINQCKFYKDMLIMSPFKIYLDVFESSQQYDLDNALKTILDCLQYVHAIVNDNQCMGIDAVKHIDRKNPRVRFAILTNEPSLL
jgi:Holliday junction resolvase RusA-like endonuclease